MIGPDRATGGLLLLLASLGASAQPAMQCGTASAVVGQTGTLTCNYLGTGSEAVGGQADFVAPDGVVFLSVECPLPTCPQGNFERSMFTVAFFSPTLEVIEDRIPLLQATFRVSPQATAGTFPVLIQNEIYSDRAINAITPNGTRNGSIEIRIEPELVVPQSVTLLPDPVDIDAVSQQAFRLDAAGGPIADLACSLDGDAQIQVLGDIPLTLPNESGIEVLAQCQSAAPGTFTAVHRCMHSGLNSPSTTEISCRVSANPPVPDPPAGSEFELILGPSRPGETVFRQFEITNQADNGSAFDVNCEFLDDGDGVFSITRSRQSGVTARSPFALRITAAEPRAGSRGQLLCSYGAGAGGSFLINLSVARAVPGLSLWALILTAILLVAGARRQGVLRGGRRAEAH